jgi:hypothetical protein
MSNKETELFVMLLRQVLDSPAYRNMSLGARALLTALKRRYWKDRHNNGHIYLSQRAAAKELGKAQSRLLVGSASYSTTGSLFKRNAAASVLMAWARHRIGG